ncbi:MAG: OmpA family protein [Bryobacteraceae bacterium]
MGSFTRLSRQYQLGAIALALFFTVVSAGCKKKTPPPPPPPPVEKPEPPPPPARPEISVFEAEPSTIQKGQASTLRWEVTGEVTEVNISPGIGIVDAKGTRQVFPSDSTTYTLAAKGPGGDAQRTASVTITTPPPPPKPKQPEPERSVSEMLRSMVQDVYFDYDRYDLREDARSTLTRNADALRTILERHPNASIILEGHADERGSAEYNLGLADRRATAAKEFLTQLGVSGDRLKTVSYGKERPQCTESNEQCWQLNRRVHFEAGQ